MLLPKYEENLKYSKLAYESIIDKVMYSRLPAAPLWALLASGYTGGDTSDC